MSLSFKIQIIIVHLWFLVCSYFMFFNEKEASYIGQKKDAEGLELYELFFYISLLILIIYYSTFIIMKYRKRNN